MEHFIVLLQSGVIGLKWIKGSIINMVATYAWGAGTGVIHSAAAKAGVLSLTRSLAVEWGNQYGIRVNAIAPGPIERTGGADKLWESEAQAQRTLESVPLKRLECRRKLRISPYLFCRIMSI